MVDGSARGRAFRKRTAGVCLGAGILLVTGPFLYRGEAASAPANTGTSTVTVSLPSVQVTDPLGTNRSVSLGSVVAGAQSHPGLSASLSLGGLAALGQTVPGVSYTSDQGTRSGTATVPVSAGPVNGSVGLVDYLVQAANGAATARMGALSGQLSAAPLGLAAGLGQHGLQAAVTPTGSSSGVELSSPGISLKLSDLLPANVLNALPLGALLQLLETTGLQLNPTLGGALDQLEGAVLGVQTLSTDLTDLNKAQATVNSLIGSNTSLAAAQAAVTADQTAVTNQQATVTQLQGQLATDQATAGADQTAVTAACVVPLSAVCATAQQTLTGATNQVTSDQAALAGAQTTLTNDQAALAAAQTTLTNLTNQAAAPGGPLATAEGLVSTLTTTVDNLLTQLQGVLSGLPNVQSLVQQLTAALGNAPLLQVGNVSVVLNTAADARSGTSSVTCTLGSVTVLGAAVAAPTCSSLGQLVSGVEAKLTSALAVLPSAARPSVILDGLQATSTPSSAPTSTGATSAGAGLSALHLAIAPISLKGLVDSLTGQLQAQLQQVLGGLGLTAPAVAHSVRPHALTLPAGLSTLLTTLTTQVGALPTGQTLAGLSTLGIDAHLVGVTSQSAFQGPAAVAPGATPSAPTPAAPAGADQATTPGHLAFTGGNEIGVLAAGLLLIVVGAQLLVFRRFEAVGG